MLQHTITKPEIVIRLIGYLYISHHFGFVIDVKNACCDVTSMCMFRWYAKVTKQASANLTTIQA